MFGFMRRAAKKPNLKKVLDALRKNEISITTREVKPGGAIYRSKLGGKPAVAAGFEWPHFEAENYDGEVASRPLSFLCQINLAEISAYDKDELLPKRGLLLFFYEQESMRWGFDPEDEGCSRVYYFEDVSALCECDLPDGLKDEYKVKEYDLSFAAKNSYPSYEELECYSDVECDWEDYDEAVVIEAVNGKIPQVVVNRVIPGVNCVSTDHRGAYRTIAAERMEHFPEALPVFMSSGGDSLPGQYRFEGFTDACRKTGRFYELWKFSPAESFSALADEMERRLKEAEGRGVLVMSDSISLTGAFMQAASRSGRCWGKDLWYSDFDDNYPENVWGVKVTSFIQNYEALMAAALERLGELLDGGSCQVPEHKLIFPLRRNGDT